MIKLVKAHFEHIKRSVFVGRKSKKGYYQYTPLTFDQFKTLVGRIELQMAFE